MIRHELLFAPEGDAPTGGGGGAPAPAAPANPAPSNPAPSNPAPSNPAPVATPPSLVGQNISSTPEPQGEVNPFEARFSSMADAEGKFTDGTREYLTGLGMDSGRVDRIMRQGGFDNAFKALDHAQSLVEKRDGVREYIPDPSNEVEFNQWRDQKGIPRDPTDPQNGYDFKSGLPEGEDLILGEDVLSEVGKMLHSSNIPKEQANTLIGQVNSALAAQAAQAKEAFTQDQAAREQKSYDEFKAKHGFEFEAKEKALGLSADAYDFDYNDPTDRLALTNPKVMAMMVDLQSLTRTTSPMIGEGGGSEGGGSPQSQIEQIMRDHPNGAWKRDSYLAGRVEVLAKQAATQK